MLGGPSDQDKVLSFVSSMQDPEKKYKSLREELKQLLMDVPPSINPDIPHLKELNQLYETNFFHGSLIDRLPRSVDSSIDKSTVDPSLMQSPIDHKSDARIYDEERICCKCQREQIRQFGIRAWIDGYDRLAPYFLDDGSDKQNSIVDDGSDEQNSNEITEGDATEENGKKVIDVKSLIDHRSPQMVTIQSLFADEREVVIKKNNGYSPESDIQASLISPRFIPDKIVEDLHIVDFSDCKGEPLTRLERKGDLATISALKRIFTAMRPLRGGREFILKEINLDSVRGWPELAQKLSEYNRYCPGSILVVSELKPVQMMKEFKGGYAFKRCKASFYLDAATRIRAASYMHDSYASEREQLAGMIQDVIVMGDILGEWKRATPEELKVRYREGLVKLTDELRQCMFNARDKHKVDVSNLCEMISSREDLQKNPMACLMTLTAVVTRFQKRLEEANYKESAKQRDVNNVIFLASKARRAFNQLAQELDAQQKIKADGWESVFNFHKIRSIIRSLNQAEVAPYNTLAKAIMEQYETYHKDAKAQEEVFGRIKFVVDLYKVNEALDSLLQGTYLAQNWQKKFDDICALYKELFDGIEKGKTVVTADVYERAAELEKRLSDAKKQSSDLLKANEDGKLVSKMRDALKNAKHVEGILDIARAMIY